MMILDPLSIATGGYVGIGPGTDFCPLPLAIGSDGYIRFEVVDLRDPFGGGTSRYREVIYTDPPEAKRDLTKLALIAVLTIEDNEI